MDILNIKKNDMECPLSLLVEIISEIRNLSYKSKKIISFHFQIFKIYYKSKSANCNRNILLIVAAFAEKYEDTPRNNYEHR